MSTQTWFIIAIVIYMVAMLLIGLWSYRQTDEYDDYMLAGMITGAVVSFAWGMTPALHACTVRNCSGCCFRNDRHGGCFFAH